MEGMPLRLWTQTQRHPADACHWSTVYSSSSSHPLFPLLRTTSGKMMIWVSKCNFWVSSIILVVVGLCVCLQICTATEMSVIGRMQSLDEVLHYWCWIFSCLLFLYTGKTHTILGTPETPGIIPRCVADLFNTVRQQQLNDTTCSFVISYSYFEIYNEKVLAYFNSIIF